MTKVRSLAALTGDLLARKGAARPAIPPEVVRQQDVLRTAYPAQTGPGSRAAFTLRLDAARHRKLRYAAAEQNCSAQQIVCQALDEFLGKPSGQEY